ncbi:hypothetical protein M2352_001309 [Azospirillum fermentarium]|uniref:hypothetical protein n=1 Tax=Azospirillum fermentarium TaxID=1233114 RepID=UPI002227813F|nr:hypothetical protein [Azospirillum fermentarium]MCW2245718.1 hypothetical protein [Azospirillum fermentarium]
MSVQGILTAAVLGALTIGTVEIRNEQARIILPAQQAQDEPVPLLDGTYGSSGGYGTMPSGSSDDTPPLRGSGLMRPDDMPPGDAFNPMPPGGDRPTRRVGGDWDDSRGLRPTELPR